MAKAKPKKVHRMLCIDPKKYKQIEKAANILHLKPNFFCIQASVEKAIEVNQNADKK